ncbi:MAG: cyclic nucleotide-binding domain-containing protein [Bacteroidia bacterium]
MKQFLKAIHAVDDAILDEYISCWEEFSVKRKTIITAEDQVQRHMFFVREGIQKSYYIDDGKEHVIAFTYPPSFSGIPDSFLPQKPSKYFLETITDSKFLRLSYRMHQEMMARYRPKETLFRIATEMVLIGLIQRHHELMAFDIETRFKTMMQRSPHLLNMIPHKDLASYLRINPTNFSKLLSSVTI